MVRQKPTDKKILIPLDLETNARVEQLAELNGRAVSREAVRLIKVGLQFESQSAQTSTSGSRP